MCLPIGMAAPQPNMFTSNFSIVRFNMLYIIFKFSLNSRHIPSLLPYNCHHLVSYKGNHKRQVFLPMVCHPSSLFAKCLEPYFCIVRSEHSNTLSPVCNLICRISGTAASGRYREEALGNNLPSETKPDMVFCLIK